jgi:CheY-like chemotaxis protein
MGNVQASRAKDKKQKHGKEVQAQDPTKTDLEVMKKLRPALGGYVSPVREAPGAVYSHAVAGNGLAQGFCLNSAQSRAQHSAAQVMILDNAMPRVRLLPLDSSFCTMCVIFFMRSLDLIAYNIDCLQ